MFRIFRRRSRRPDPPAVTHTHFYNARFMCTRDWHYQLLRAALCNACAATAPTQASARVTMAEWNGHAAVIEITLTVPWSAPAAGHTAQADALVHDLIDGTSVGSWLLHLERDGDPVPAANWSAIAEHRDLADLAAHCHTYYTVDDDRT